MFDKTKDVRPEVKTGWTSAHVRKQALARSSERADDYLGKSGSRKDAKTNVGDMSSSQGVQGLWATSRFSRKIPLPHKLGKMAASSTASRLDDSRPFASLTPNGVLFLAVCNPIL